MPSIWFAPQTPSCQLHIYIVLKATLRKSRSIKLGTIIHSVIIAIEYSYMLGRENLLKSWCKLGQLLHRQSHNYSKINHTFLMYKIHKPCIVTFLYWPWLFVQTRTNRILAFCTGPCKQNFCNEYSTIKYAKRKFVGLCPFSWACTAYFNH